jgi:hypothetical protein
MATYLFRRRRPATVLGGTAAEREQCFADSGGESMQAGSQDGQPLPDPKCTPGAINPAVTQANINDAICKAGWTKTVRPPVSVTNKIKQQIDTAYGLSTSTQGELDHDVSLELGGAPDDPRNLWLSQGQFQPQGRPGEQAQSSSVFGAGPSGDRAAGHRDQLGDRVR